MNRSDLEFLRHAIKVVGTEKMFGMENVVRLMMIALISRGHILLEGNPGLGKTAVVKCLADALGMQPSTVGRIQFTPDLMPSDITGTLMPDENNVQRLAYKPGPIFHNLLIADEINRATPKTQSAMLEAMAEFQVSGLDKTRPLCTWQQIRDPANPSAPLLEVLTPFMVMATQNPVDQEGVNPLPEAQLDRFLTKISIPFPDAETLAKILRKEVAPQSRPAEIGPESKTVPQAYFHLTRLNSGLAKALVEMGDETEAHILNMVLASNREMDQVQGLSPRRMRELTEIANTIEYPFGPRAATAMSWAALGWSALLNISTDEPDQIGPNAWQGLAATIVPVLRHRIKFSMNFDYETEALNMIGHEQIQHDQKVAELAVHAAPDGSGYAEKFKAAINARPNI